MPAANLPARPPPSRRLRKAKKAAVGNEKPDAVRTHLRDMIIVPEMIGAVVGVYNGKTFNNVEIKPEMIGHYLAEFSISYKPTCHGRPGERSDRTALLTCRSQLSASNCFPGHRALGLQHVCCRQRHRICIMRLLRLMPSFDFCAV